MTKIKFHGPEVMKGSQTAPQPKDLNSQARSLIHRSLDSHDARYGCGSMSCAVYDTAWVSMVTKDVNGETQWLFPESFHFLLHSQAADGSWGASSHSQLDGILNTAAALLSLAKHAKESLQMRELDLGDLEDRKRRAAASLGQQLKAWDVEATTHVGFEVIVPAVLERLSDEDSSFHWDFDGRSVLAKLNAAKLARFSPDILYRVKTTAIHSLEAFIGKIDFDQVKHHLVHGSMMGSPSSTAAYLMHASRWDGEAEAYLRHVIDAAAGKGSGGVPSAFPSLHFEHTWVLSTLLRDAFRASDLRSNDLKMIEGILVKAFEREKGTIGFAPGFEPDVDDTAKGILTLQMLGRNVSAAAMVREFEGEDHFKTYPRERDPSFSANCNALLALLQQTDVSSYSSQITKAVCFLCNYWWDADDVVTDKWVSYEPTVWWDALIMLTTTQNLCHLYPRLLLAEAFVDLLACIESGKLPADILDSELRAKVSITLFQACARALLDQQSNGSWSYSAEPTAYGVLILCEARKLWIFGHLREEIDAAIFRGASYLNSTALTPEPIWIEKVSYASPLLTEAYVLAALKAAESPVVPAASLGTAALHWDATQTAKMGNYVHLFGQTPLFSQIQGWKTRLSALEASLFVPLLQARRLDVFPRKNMEKDKYFAIIPFTWTACNNRSGAFASTSFLYEMMVISFLNYQADEFMEAVAGPAFRGNLAGLRQLIEGLFHVRTGANGHQIKAFNITGPNADVHEPLRRFATHVLTNPSIRKASAWDQATLARELRTFLLAHVTQTEDNTRFAQDQNITNATNSNKQHGPQEFTSARTSFFQWVRTTSADHTSCPYSFAFVAALLSASVGDGADCFPTVREKYLAEAACRHLATMCRMYNDYGSLARDRAELNLNSVDFPEFGRGGSVDVVRDERKKEALFSLADYERSCLDLALGGLETQGRMEEEVGPETFDSTATVNSHAKRLHGRKMAIWRMFCDVTDLYGQIYVVRDIASRMKA